MNRNQTDSRSNVVRQRRRQQSTRRLAQTVQRAHKPMVKPSRPGAYKATTRGKSQRQHYGIAFALGTAEVRAPGITLPKLGTRTVSGILAILLAFLLYTLWNSPAFTVSGADVTGNERLSVDEINTGLQLIGQPIFVARPEIMEQTLLLFYPDLERVDVKVALPNRVIVTVKERTPVIAWNQDGGVKWIDSNGMVFPQRGQVEGLITINASGNPPPIPADPENPESIPPFLAPDMIQAIIDITPYIPSDSSLAFDPIYGFGWQDSRGWRVYFGENTKDVPTKLLVYQAIVDHLIRQGIQPALISVEYLDAPYYRLH